MEKEVTREPNNVKPPATQPASVDAPTNGKHTVRYASDEQFKKAHKKTSKAHAGLFRRLAQ
jgi:hypothetical protein